MNALEKCQSPATADDFPATAVPTFDDEAHVTAHDAVMRTRERTEASVGVFGARELDEALEPLVAPTDSEGEPTRVMDGRSRHANERIGALERCTLTLRSGRMPFGR
jgi:hypothetical protein